MNKLAMRSDVKLRHWVCAVLGALVSGSCAMEHDASGAARADARPTAPEPRSTFASPEDFARLPELPNESMMAGLRRRDDDAEEPEPDEDAVVGLLTSALSSGCGPTCDFKDPATFQLYDGHWYTCADDAFTVDLAVWDEAYAELRYSPRCRTVWTRSNHLVTPVCGATIYSLYPDETARTQADMPHTDGVGWTPMLNDAGLLGFAGIWCAGSGNYTMRY
jgi:hypothetical protein